MLKKMNLPNKLTLSRMVIAPIYLALMLIDFKYHFLVAGIVFGIASLTDFFDGHLARKYNQITVFGKLCDPVGDKMLFLAALLAFLKYGMCSSWVIMIVISREFIITSLRMVAIEQNVVIAAGFWGKLKTACQMVFTVLIMIMMQFGLPSWCAVSVSVISNILMWLVAVLTVVSGAKYLYDSKRLINFSK
ncbi:MAG: CDP-diacylglycerol--glycerol-3-phosphate 3-phosphatidyltransferase [Faecalibacterium sp.]|nr:CDP-diacylglycerol--glycerol-3-phosphate 3-phosphatidyltransferase [Ruminococcus sp.]MCM1393049.1 CDP-diacylglycerol--glycerol-3-phosphate 3-phosphatidyltransferase [Ruminococcus sp.]MCM1486287.1 CDP-diacylglycerol--glycerol-3-phosphate 3-phosphatidyltransferase [Faecalibacterium sp.]